MHRSAKKRVSNKARKARAAGRTWQLQDAKARFSQLVRDAQKLPQIITLHGQEIAVVQSIQDYKKNQDAKADKGPNLLELLLKCPPGPPLVVERDPDDTVDRMRNIFDE